MVAEKLLVAAVFVVVVDRLRVQLVPELVPELGLELGSEHEPGPEPGHGHEPGPVPEVCRSWGIQMQEKLVVC